MVMDTTANPDTNPVFQALLDASAERLGNPLVLMDTSYNLLATGGTPADDDPLWSELTALGRFSEDTVRFFGQAKFVAAVAESDVVSLLQHKDLPYDRACGKIFDSAGVQWGDVVVVARWRPFAPEDFVEIAALCERLSEANGRSAGRRQAAQVLSDALLERLMEGGESPDSPALAALYERLDANIFVLVADIARFDPQLTHLAYFRDVFAALPPRAPCFVCGSHVAMLLSSREAFLRAKTDLSALQDCLARYNINAGVSAAFQNLLELRTYYRQALEALNLGGGQPCGQHLFQYETFGTDCFLSAVQDIARLRELCNPAVLQLREHDAACGTALRQLLEVYLLNAKNETRSCEQLGIPLPALRERLLSLEERFAIDWDNGNQLSSLLISCKILRRAEEK